MPAAEMKIIDISVPLSPRMVSWPGDPVFRIKREKSLGKNSSCNLSSVSMGVHCGTHLDAPYHFILKGKTVDQARMDYLIGPARVLQIKDGVSVKMTELLSHKIMPGERILLKTRNSDRCWVGQPFRKDFVYVSHEAAQYLASQRLKVLGIDYLSVGGFKKDGKQTHKTLLKAGVWLLEGLDFSGVKPGRYQLICLPLKIVGADGAPARAVLT